MAPRYTAQKAKFREGLEELLFVSPEYGSLARAMGAPVFDESQETAYVTYDGTAIMFAFNPDFIMTLSVDETAAVILHEAHHVILKHLEEAKDTDQFPDDDARIKAHECIINDTIKEVFEMTLPGGIMFGEDLLGESCANKLTKPVYDKFAQKNEAEDNEQGQDETDENTESISAGGQGQGVSSGDSGESNKGDSKDEAEDEKDTSEDSTGDGESSEGNADEPEGGSGGDRSQDGDGDDSEEGAGDAESDGQPGTGGSFACGGVRVSDEYADAFAGAIEDLIEDAANDKKEAVDEFKDKLMDSRDSGGGFSPNGAGGIQYLDSTAEKMNWKHLLGKINPKVLEAGRRRRKVRNNWTTPNRRLRSVYPKVILPVSETVKPKKDDKGDTLPVFIVALDLSGSIPRHLVNTLKSMIEDIPSDLIKAYPCTWSSQLVPFDPKVGAACRTGGTEIRLVSEYARQVKKETGTDPYVLVITDGEFWTNFEQVGKDWFFMAVQDQDVPWCKKHAKTPEHVYKLSDFKE